ncbi:MAG: hypothetical protein ACLTYH_05635 [Streptococcus salivarius]
MNRAKQLDEKNGSSLWTESNGSGLTNQAKFEIASQAFDTITQRYNNSRGYYGTKINYATAPSMTTEERSEFESHYKEITLAIRQNILEIACV